MATLPNRVRYLVFDTFLLPNLLHKAYNDREKDCSHRIDGLPADARVVWTRLHDSGVIGPRTKIEVGMASEEFDDVPYGAEPKMDVVIHETALRR